ncbi:MAG: hypothetical protein HY709_00240 [Candidatus Latescibacteria bacterium]|nr:hypothetical protein [Candidatus Latescibacterota bacterium]
MEEHSTLKLPFNFGPFTLQAGTPIKVLHVDRHYGKAFIEILDPSSPVKTCMVTLMYIEGDRKKEGRT